MKGRLAQLARVALLLGGLLSVAMTDSAQAEDEPVASETASARRPRRALLPFRADLHGVLTWEAEFGAGLRADIPIYDETRLYNGRDEISLSAGLDLSFVTFGGANRVTFWPTIAVQWSLSVTEHFVFYPELGIVAKVEPQDFKGLFPNVGFGGRINVYRSLDVLLRLGWPMAVTIGLTF